MYNYVLRIFIPFFIKNRSSVVFSGHKLSALFVRINSRDWLFARNKTPVRAGFCVCAEARTTAYDGKAGFSCKMPIASECGAVFELFEKRGKVVGFYFFKTVSTKAISEILDK